MPNRLKRGEPTWTTNKQNKVIQKQLTRYFHKQCNLIVLFRFVTHRSFVVRVENWWDEQMAYFWLFCAAKFEALHWQLVVVVVVVFVCFNLSPYRREKQQISFYECVFIIWSNARTYTYISQIAFTRAMNIWIETNKKKATHTYIEFCCSFLIALFSFCVDDFEFARLPASLLEHRKQNFRVTGVWARASVCMRMHIYIYMYKWVAIKIYID